MTGIIDPKHRREALLDKRFTEVVQSGVDLEAVATWDHKLSRRTRIVVPADVQAYVVSSSGGEACVAITGGQGDPEPFAAGAPRPVGVHLHWAMPDALLAGKQSQTASTLTLPRLPDRWVVVRTLQPANGRAVGARGWVIDAPTGSVTPLETYNGTPTPAAPGTPVLQPLDGVRGGSLLWTASYTASADRFGFHDPLTDLPMSARFEANQAVYTVAGWWSDLAGDPLAAATGPSMLDRRLAELGWLLDQDGEETVADPELAERRSDVGLSSPGDIKAGIALPVDQADKVLAGRALPRYATLVHGSVLGVPVQGALPPEDDRPSSGALGVALGQDVDDVVAAFGAKVLNLAPAHRRSAETIVAAFTSGLIEQLGAPDGLEDLAEREHGDGFWALPGTQPPAARPDRLRAEDSAPMGPLTVGRKGRAAQPAHVAETRLEWGGPMYLRSGSGGKTPASRRTEESRPAAIRRTPGEARQVVRPAPRFFRPQAPMLALRGARPNHRHHGDGLHDESGRLRCRYPDECVQEITGVVSGASILASLGSGAVPAEVLLVVREAVLLNPYGYRWLAAAGAPAPDMVDAYTNRLAAEMVRLHGADGSYGGSSHTITGTQQSTWDYVSAERTLVDRQISASLAEHSLVRGTPPSPVGFTTWRQPWVPLWLEWRVTLDGHDSAAGWELDGIDLRPPATAPGPAANPVHATYSGRSPLSQGVSKALHLGIERWLEAERQRDATGSSTLPTADQNALERLGDLLVPLDLMSASLDGIREQMLGIPYVGVVERPSGADARPQATALPTPLFAGSLTIEALRLVDAFGRTLDVPLGAGVSTTLDLEVPGLARGIRMRPRIQHLARWLFRLVDPAQAAAADPAELREAFVDQLDPQGAVNPVAGFLLPDHIDEELEAFTVAGEPIGAIGHDAVTGAVTWETAPGRPVPPDAGPLADLEPHARIAGEIAAGLVMADAAARDSSTPPTTSALSALLRAIDTTLWTVDTFAALGSPTVAGLIGRPVAIVRAALRLDTPDDLDEVEVTAPGGVAARQAAFAALADQRFTVKLGALTRTDDALLGFYVDDDYTQLRLVDRVIAVHALESGRHRGHLGLLGSVTRPPADPLEHPYLVPDGRFSVRPGQTIRLTLLMLPLGRVHLTSGILPRKQLALSDEWVTPGLRRLVPSVRVGPVLVDPAEIRLPLVHLLGDKQTFTRRTGPLTWRHDPIVAATQTAYLPRLPHEVQEGWVRVTPADPETPGGQA